MNHQQNPAPYFWVRKIAEQLREYDQIPLFGNAPPFDWTHLSAVSSACFGIQHPLLFHPRSQSWKTAEEMKEGLGDEPIVLPLKAGSLNGSVFWIMSKEGVLKFTSWMLNGQAKGSSFSSEILAEGFYRYLALQIMDALDQMEPLQQTPLLLSETSPLPDTDAFCIDVEIDFDKHSCWGRLAIEPKLQRSWAEYFSHSAEYIPEKTAKITELNIGIKVGSTLLSRQEWKKLKKGDFVLLDQDSYDPRKQTGAAYLMLGQTPLFTVKVKQNKVQLIDYAFIYEEEMEKTPTPEPQENPIAGPSEELAPAEEGEAVSLKELPIYVTVELARMRITLEKLMQLTPGNLINLPIHPDQAVKLMVNGQLVGHAELVHLGEKLGLRILDLG